MSSIAKGDERISRLDEGMNHKSTKLVSCRGPPRFDQASRDKPGCAVQTIMLDYDYETIYVLLSEKKSHQSQYFDTAIPMPVPI